MLSLKNVSFSYGDRVIYNNMSLEINNSGSYYLDSPNGSGKTTLFKILKGEVCFNGTIEIDGNPIFSDEITLIDYTTLIERRLTVYQQLKIFIQSDDEIDRLLTEFKLEGIKNSRPYKMSSGERARLAFLLGILENKKVILIDELFSHLDLKSIEIINKYIMSISKDRIVIFTSHKTDRKPYYNYVLKIENCNLSIQQHEAINSSNEFKVKTKVDYKVVDKALNIGYRYLVGGISIILIFIAFIFAILATISEERLEYKYIRESRTIPYIVDTRIDFTPNNNLIDMVDKDLKNDYILDGYEAKYKIFNTFDLYNDGGYFTDFLIDRIIIDNSLNDCEIAISDFLYNSLKEGEIIIEDTIEYIMFSNTKLKIAYVFNSSIYEDMNNDIPSSRYFNGLCYLNKKTYEALMSDSINALKGYYTAVNYKKISLGILDSVDAPLIEGRLPENSNEILVNHVIFPYLRLGMAFNQEISFYKNENSDFKYQNFKNILLDKKVVGFTSYPGIILYDENSYDSFLKSSYDCFRLYGIDFKKFGWDDYKEIKANGYDIIFSEIDNYDAAVLRLNSARYINISMSIVIAIITIVFITSYLILERHYYAKDISAIKRKPFSKDIIAKIRRKHIISLILILAMVFTILFVVGGTFGVKIVVDSVLKIKFR